MSLSLPIATAARAPGKMRLYELTLGSVQIALFFCAWILLSLGGPAYSVFIVAIGVNILMFIVRLLIIRTLIGFRVISFIKQVIVPLGTVVLFASVPVVCIKVLFPSGDFFLVFRFIFSVVTSLLAMYSFGLDGSGKQMVQNFIRHQLAWVTK